MYKEIYLFRGAAGESYDSFKEELPVAYDKTWYDGIVEEHVREEADLLNPFRFFGKPWIILYNMFLVYSDTKSFIDYKRIETYLVKEIVFKDSKVSYK